MELESIDLRRVRTHCGEALDAVIEALGPELSINQDYLWAIVDPRIADPAEPPIPTIGQVSELVGFTQKSELSAFASSDLAAARLRWLGQLLQGIAMNIESR